MYWTRKMVKYSLKPLFNLFKEDLQIRLNADMQIKTPTFSAACTLRAEHKWLNYTSFSGGHILFKHLRSPDPPGLFSLLLN